MIQVGGTTIHVGDCREVLASLPAESVNACVTSPPYFGLRSYLPDGHSDKAREIGLERTVDAYVAGLVEVFREVRRVLRPDGTLWLNLGDSYAGGGGGNYGNKIAPDHGQHVTNVRNRPGWLAANGLKPKDLIGVPWMVAFALRADGWFLRSEIIWHKPNPMPESVTDRPTKAHEYVFMLTKSARYFFDADAVREEAVKADYPRTYRLPENSRSGLGQEQHNQCGTHPLGRNIRSVWMIATQPYPEAHFATMPPALAERCVKAGTSEKGCCPGCGAPWARVTERAAHPAVADSCLDRFGDGSAGVHRTIGSVYQRWLDENPKRTTGWHPSCSCDAGEPVPCTVLDPFGGAGTVGLVAKRLGRDATLIELNPAYAELARERLAKDAPLLSAPSEKAA